jgi:hypothetical protein
MLESDHQSIAPLARLARRRSSPSLRFGVRTDALARITYVRRRRMRVRFTKGAHGRGFDSDAAAASSLILSMTN